MRLFFRPDSSDGVSAVFASDPPSWRVFFWENVMLSKQLRASFEVKRRKPVEQKCGLPRSTIYARVADGTFPPPIRIGARAVAWIDHELDAILRAHVRGLRADELRMLVCDLVAARDTTI